MKSSLPRIFSSLLILMVLVACSLTPAITPPQPVSDNPANSTEVSPASVTSAPIPFVAEMDGPAGFSASLFAPDIVLLTWDTVAEAVGYQVQIVFKGLDPLPIAFLGADATSFTHYLAPESSLLTYRLQTITTSGPGGASSLQIRTQTHKPNPLSVQASFSETVASSAVIGPSGGTIEVTDEHGVNYSLTIPPQAIGTDLEIKMSPINTIEGWPLDGGFLGGVQLEPEGWLLDEIATLTIRIPSPVAPDLATVGFAFSGSGDEFHLTPSYADTSSMTSLGTRGSRLAKLFPQEAVQVIRLPVMELKVTGVGETSTKAATQMASENSPTSSKDAADQKAAVTDVMDDELAPLLSLDELGQMATDNLLTQVLNAQDCYEFKQAVGSFQTWESRVTQSSGDHYSNYSGDRQVLLDQLAEKALQTIENAGEECTQAAKGVVPASVPCAEKLTRDIQSASNPFFAELQNTMKQNPGMLDRLTKTAESSDKCPHSFKVNEAASLGYRWTSGCIPSLDRSYQLVWIGTNLSGTFNFFPYGPFSGRVEGQGQQSMPGVTITHVYQGNYKIDITKTDNLGDPQEMDANLTIKDTVTQCIEGAGCQTFTDDTDQLIPLLVNKSRCVVP